MPVSDILARSRILLNDATGKLYNDATLLPYYNMAQSALQDELEIIGAQFLKNASALITVTALTTELPPPADLVEPITLFENDEGGDIQNFTEMEELPFLPLVRQETVLRYWSFQDDTIKFVGATQNRDVIVRYLKGLTDAVNPVDPIEYPKGFNYLAYETAALTAAYTGESERRAATLETKAAIKLSTIKRKIVRNQQSLPARRKPFFRRNIPYLYWRG